MNKYLLMLTLFSNLAFAFENEPDGFRGLKWQDDFSQHETNLSIVEDGKNVKFYSKKDDQLKIGGAELEQIVYGFRENKFGYVIIKVNGYSNKSALIDAFKTQFGRGIKRNKYIDRYEWTGSTAMITIDCKTLRDECSAYIQSTAVFNEARQKEKDAAANAAKDF